MRWMMAMLLAAGLAWPAAAQQADHPMVARFRALLPDTTRLAFASQAPLPGGADGVRLGGVTLTRPDETLRIAELELEGLEETRAARVLMRGLEASGGEPMTVARIELERLAYAPRPGQDPEPGDFRVDALTIEGFESGRDPRLRIARAVLRDYGPGRTGSLTLEGMVLDSLPSDMFASISLGRAAVSGFDLAGLLDAAVRQQQPAMPQSGRVSVSLENLVLTDPSKAVMGGAESMLLEGDASPTAPGTGRFALRGIRVERSAATAGFLDALELPRLEASLTIDTTHEPSVGRIGVPAMALGVQNLGAVALAFTMEGWTPDMAQPGTLPDLERLRLVDARLRYVDEGLYARSVRAQSREQRLTEAQVRQQHAQMLGAMLTAPNPPPGLNQLRQALLGVVEGRVRGVELTARPPQPLPFPRIQQAAPEGAAAVIRLLGVTARGQ